MVDITLLIVAGFPLLLFVYFGISLWITTRSGRPQFVDRYGFWVYAPFAFAVSGIVLLRSDVSVPVTVAWYYPLLVVVGVALYRFDTRVWYQDADESTAAIPLLHIAPVLVVPIPEELLFRMALLPLVESVGTVGYTAASALLFGACHFYFGREEVVMKSINGALYAVTFLATGSLLAPLLFHTGYNAAALRALTRE